jgi:hypothetical protein
MEELRYDELEDLNGGGLVGALAGGILGLAAGSISGTVATIYYGDTSGKILVKHMYTGACAGAGIGAVVSGPI